MTAAAPTLTELRAQWDAPFPAGPADDKAYAARTALTRELAAGILTADLCDPSGAARTRVGPMVIAGAGWSRETWDAASALAEPGSDAWRAALTAHDHVTLTADGETANRETWCRCGSVTPAGWVRYELWTAQGMDQHGYVHTDCRRKLQEG